MLWQYSIVANEPKPDSASAERVVKMNFVKQKAGQKSELAAELKFQPGKRAKFKVGGAKSNDTTTTIELAVDSKLNEQPVQYLFEVKVIEQNGNEEPSILAAPKLVADQSQQACIQIGEENGDGIKIELVVEQVK